jgi:ABC-2 type transport system permease protein
VIRAILRAQWLSMRSFRLGSSRRGAVFSIITAVIWYGFWTFLASMAEDFTSSGEAADAIRKWLPIGLMIVFLYWQVAPIVSASLGASLDLKKLLIYPVPHRKLFVIEVTLRLTICVEILLLIGGVMIGLLRNPFFGGMGASPRLIAPFLLFILFNLLLATGLRNLLERLLTHKRLREILMLILVTSAAVPQVLIATRARSGRMGQFFSEAPGGFWPWTAVSRIALGQEILFSASVLIFWTAAAFLFGRWQFERSLRYDAQATGGRSASANERTGSRLELFYRLPGLFLPDPLAAIAEKELRALSRAPRFRMVFIMGFSFGLIVWLPVTLGRQGQGSSVIADHYLTVVSVYALTLLGQVSYLNAFGFDRSAAQIYFSVPVSMRKALAGKNVAAALFILVEMLAITLVSTLFRSRIPVGKVLEAYVVTAIVGIYLLATGNLSSVHFPRAMNPERVSQGGAASRMQALIFLFYPVALLPVFLAFWARYVFESELIFYLILTFAAILGAAVYWIAMDSATQTAVERREKILMELSRGEGPLATE